MKSLLLESSVDLKQSRQVWVFDSRGVKGTFRMQRFPWVLQQPNTGQNRYYGKRAQTEDARKRMTFRVRQNESKSARSVKPPTYPALKDA